jgi:rubrerythrin
MVEHVIYIIVYTAKRRKKAFEFYNNISELIKYAEPKKLFVRLAQEE